MKKIKLISLVILLTIVLSGCAETIRPKWTICNTGWGYRCVQTYGEDLQYIDDCVITAEGDKFCGEYTVKRWR